MSLTINGELVNQELIDQEFERLRDEHRNNGGDCCTNYDEHLEEAKENVITHTLILQSAKAMGFMVTDAELETELTPYYDEYGGKERFEEINAFDEETKLSFEKSHIDTILSRKFVDHLAKDFDKSDNALQVYYEKNAEKFYSNPGVHLKQILKQATPGDQMEAAFELMKSLRQELLSGAEFDALAAEHSDYTEGQADLGVIAKGELPPELEAIAFSLNIDEISPVFLSNWGYHIITVIAHQEPELIPLDEIKEDVQYGMELDFRINLIKEFVDHKKTESEIIFTEDDEEE